MQQPSAVNFDKAGATGVGVAVGGMGVGVRTADGAEGRVAVAVGALLGTGVVMVVGRMVAGVGVGLGAGIEGDIPGVAAGAGVDVALPPGREQEARRRVASKARARERVE